MIDLPSILATIDVPGFIDWALGRLTLQQWDAWRNWLATIGGLVALTVAVRTYRRNVRTKVEEQARLVYAKAPKSKASEAGVRYLVRLYDNDTLVRIGDSIAETTDSGAGIIQIVPFVPLRHLTIVVHNGSKERIGPALLDVYSSDGQEVIATAPTFEDIDPESEVVVEILLAPSPGGEPVGASLRFRDASGRWWKRHLLEPVRPIRSARPTVMAGDNTIYRAPRD